MENTELITKAIEYIQHKKYGKREASRISVIAMTVIY